MYASTLEKKITKFVRKFGIKRAYCKGDFMYFENGTVFFSITRIPRHHPDYVEFINNKYEINIVPWFFIFSLLHEVGHHMTIPQLTEEQKMYEYTMRMMKDLDQKTYLNLPAEDLANKWAIDYITNHQQECWDFQKKCSKIMRHIYKKKSFHY